MISVTLRINTGLSLSKLRGIRQDLQALPARSLKKFKDLTPIDTGNARANTRLVNRRRIEADYEYAQVLDKGRHMTKRGTRGSKQAPKGMTKPFIEWYRKEIRALLNKRRLGRVR
jgi:hypothetical protein